MPVLGKELHLKIPPGTSAEKVFRLKGLGVPKTQRLWKGRPVCPSPYSGSKDGDRQAADLLEQLSRELRHNGGALARRGLKQKFKEFFDWKE